MQDTQDTVAIPSREITEMHNNDSRFKQSNCFYLRFPRHGF